MSEFKTSTLWKATLVVVSLVWLIKVCSEGDLDALEDRADRARLVEISLTAEVESILDPSRGIFEKKMQVLREGGILVEGDRVFMAGIPDVETKGIDFPRELSELLEQLAERTSEQELRIWVDGEPLLMDSDPFELASILTHQQIMELLLHSPGDGGERDDFLQDPESP